MTEGKNFSGQVTPSIIDTEYEFCNFTQGSPIDVAGKKRGVRLFPGDDTPRTFTRCNMTNAEPPPGSTLVDCNTTIRELYLVSRTDTVTIDEENTTVEHHINRIHGRLDPNTLKYIDLPVPIDKEVD